MAEGDIGVGYLGILGLGEEGRSRGVLAFSGSAIDPETVTIGVDVYELDNTVVPSVTSGRLRVDISGGTAGIKAQGTLTLDTQPSLNDTMTIGVGAGVKVYTFVAAVDAVTDGLISRGTSLATAKTALVAAINGTDGVNSAHTQVTAAAFSGNNCIITARVAGLAGNSIATTETFTAVTNVFDAATLGTTTLGTAVASASEAVTALALAINTLATEDVTASDAEDNTVVVQADTPNNPLATTTICAHASWENTTLVGTYGTEVRVTQRVPLLSTTVDDVQVLNRSVALEGRAFERPPDAGIVNVTGDVVAQLRYGENNLLLKHLMGSLVGKQYRFTPTRLGMGLTMAVDKQVSPWGIYGTKLSQLVLASTIERVTLTATTVGQNIVRPSLLNTQAVLRALENSDANVLHRHLVLYIGDLVDALSGSDRFRPTALTVTMQRPVDTVHVDAQEMIEPAENGVPTFSLVMPLARHMTDQFKTWQKNNTALQARAYWTNGVHGIEILLGSIHVQTDPIPTAGPGPLVNTVTFHVSEDLRTTSAETLSFASADNSINDSAAGLPYVLVGAEVQVRGAAASANNQRLTVVSRTASKMVVSGAALTTAAAGPRVTLDVRNPPILITEN